MNCPLEFKARESADEDSDSEPEPVRPVSPPPKVAKKKKKVPKNSQNGQKPPKMPVKVRKEDSDSDIELLVDGKIPAKKPMPLKKVFTKGFPCSYCPKKFTHKNNLRVHMKEKHKEQLLQWYEKNSGSPNPIPTFSVNNLSRKAQDIFKESIGKESEKVSKSVYDPNSEISSEDFKCVLSSNADEITVDEQKIDPLGSISPNVEGLKKMPSNNKLGSLPYNCDICHAYGYAVNNIIIIKHRKDCEKQNVT